MYTPQSYNGTNIKTETRLAKANHGWIVDKGVVILLKKPEVIYLVYCHLDRKPEELVFSYAALFSLLLILFCFYIFGESMSGDYKHHNCSLRKLEITDNYK